MGVRSREPLYWKGGSAPVPDPTVQICCSEVGRSIQRVGPAALRNATQEIRQSLAMIRAASRFTNAQFNADHYACAGSAEAVRLQNQIADQLLSGANSKHWDLRQHTV